ncbi:MAG TPA: GDP-mannose 4,6-dehydratase [Candidatus Paceibacterota bacterium]|nr:GDP-mannose 4,6-dehydratase [Candidatus Paceibacterota bacterium]
MAKEPRKKAIITGITGQDGSYLADFLLSKGYEVHGIVRRASTMNRERIQHLHHDPHASRSITLHYGDLADANTIRRLLYEVEPDEIYHLGAQSHVRVSFDVPEYTANITGLGTLRILEAIKDYEKDTGKKVRFYQASSSEMFGAAPPPQNEETKFYPRSPYGAAKVFAYDMTRNYREAYGIYAVNGILFNHESPRRGEAFVTRKIAIGVAKIAAGLEKKLYLGNLEARRDWGYAPEYVEAMWIMLQQPEPDDYVIGTGQSYKVQDYVNRAFEVAGLGDPKQYIGIDERYYRPTEVRYLLADATKAKEKLGWQAVTTFDNLVKIMVRAELRRHGQHERAEKIIVENPVTWVNE